ncbi:MAG: nuclear transport factor 2 family protein [Rhodococcus sp. (in: high G+C Gram-positive bacteria)]|nr:MAG: nuclear transport factor 2 family protein [Rhodococcus sp. (in: high G+C Gram-positive bacteria)]
MTDGPELDPVTVAVRFNECINRRDPDAMSELMSEDHCFVDTEGAVISGRQPCLDAWRVFFASFPDYRNHFTSVTVRGGVATAVGNSVCSKPSLAGPALWTAVVRHDRVAEWRVLRRHA